MIIAKEIGLNNDELQAIVSLFKSYSNISEVILFGSRAMGSFRNGSDVDLAMKGVSNHKEWLDIMIAVDELDLPYKFDLIQYEKIDNSELIAHIKRVGKRII